MNNSQHYIGKIVKVKIDRPLGSLHPKHGFIYPVNYGYIPNTISGDGEELDAYILGTNLPLSDFEGKCIAIIHRLNDNDDKLIVVPKHMFLSDAEIEQQTSFQEKWFRHILIRSKPAIYLMCGFLGFGKTTAAKKLEQELPAIRFTHDEIMLKKFGRTPNNFQARYKEVDDFIRSETDTAIKSSKNVILDYGFWNKEKRAEYFQWARTLTPNVQFYAILCDIDIARKRVIERSQNNLDELFIDESCFNNFLQKYEPISLDEGYPTILNNYSE
ncbi:MAG: AAA family ATPase [Alphaproteobacteria bacterium]|nr:AAA family ATPase [Alphaproteobacteria bacterium]